MTALCTHDADARARGRDPTGTTTLRRAFEADLVRRLSRVRRQMVQAVVQMDVLGLRTGSLSAQIQSEIFARAFAPTADLPTRAFATFAPAEKTESLSRWIRILLERELLGDWQSRYVAAAYDKGVRDARAESGPPVREPSFSHQERLGLLRVRANRDLRGVADATEQQISRALSSSLQSTPPSAVALARILADRVLKVGVARARVHASVTVVGAHAEGSLTAYEEAGVRAVGTVSERVPGAPLTRDADPPVLSARLGGRRNRSPINAEHPERSPRPEGSGLRGRAESEVAFTTAGDDLVCEICESMEDDVYTVEEARGVIPVHPNCRCKWVPA